MTENNDGDFEGEDHELDIEVVDDNPPEDDSSDGEDGDELASYSKNVQKRIKKLTWEAREAQREAEKRAREQAVMVDYTKRTMAENQALKRALNNGQNLIADQLKTRVNTELVLAEKQLKEAFELGNIDEQVKAQRHIAKLSVESARAESYQPQRISEEAPELPVIQEDRPTPTPRAMDWHKRNRWFGNDQTMTQYCRHIHDRLVVFDHVDPNSEGYWAKLDDEMHKRFPHLRGDSESEADDEPAPRETRRTNVVAPVKRSAAPRNKVQLTSTEVAIARRLGLTLEQYAEEKLRGNRNG